MAEKRANEDFPNMTAELRRRLEQGGRHHAAIVFDVTEKQAQQLADENQMPIEKIRGGTCMLWGVPVRVLP